MKGPEAYRWTTAVLASVIALCGLAIVVRSLAEGADGSSLGVLIGVVFVALGGARLALALRGTR